MRDNSPIDVLYNKDVNVVPRTLINKFARQPIDDRDWVNILPIRIP